jgi:Poly-beta-hydroxybutyrate polymerase N terminal
VAAGRDRLTGDQILHAGQARVTAGLSPTLLTLANRDWAVHLAGSPAAQQRSVYKLGMLADTDVTSCSRAGATTQGSSARPATRTVGTGSRPTAKAKPARRGHVKPRHSSTRGFVVAGMAGVAGRAVCRSGCNPAPRSPRGRIPVLGEAPGQYVRET